MQKSMRQFQQALFATAPELEGRLVDSSEAEAEEPETVKAEKPFKCTVDGCEHPGYTAKHYLEKHVMKFHLKRK